MRKLILGLALTGSILAIQAAPAFAQNTQLELDNLRARQQAAQQRSIGQSNELMALEAQQRADVAVANLRTQQYAPAVPELPYRSSAADAARAAAATAKYPSIPDAALADSNRRVQDAANRR